MLVMLILAAGVSVGGVFLFNALPADWFCDYDETPNPDRKRLPLWAAGLFFAVLAFILLQAGAMEGLPLVLLLLFAFVCLLTAASDILYRILPDQFLVVLAALGLFYAVSTSAVFLQSLLAGVLASGLIFLLGIVGKLAFKAEAMGFGDVKLVAGRFSFPRSIPPYNTARPFQEAMCRARQCSAPPEASLGEAKRRFGRRFEPAGHSPAEGPILPC